MLVASYTLRDEFIVVYGVESEGSNGDIDFDYFDLYDVKGNCLNEGKPLLRADLNGRHVCYDPDSKYAMPSEEGVEFFLDKLGHWK